MQINSHLSRLVHDVAAKYGDREALIYKNFGGTQWKSCSWNQFSGIARQVSDALLALGVGEQENIGIFSQNSVQYLFVDFGAWGIRAVTVPFYATSSEQQIQFMINDAQIRFLFVGEQEQFDKAHRVFPTCQSLERIIVFDPAVKIPENDPSVMSFSAFLKLGEGLTRKEEFNRRQAAATMDDIANILYTSGTTGDSKGVILTYGQYHAAFEANDKCVPVGENDRIMNFLPITHIFERGWIILCLTEGSEIIVNTYPKEIQQSLKEMHPTCMSAVPRFWEKVYIGVKEKIEKANAVERKLFNRALAVGRKYHAEFVSKGKRAPLPLKLEYETFDRTLFSLVRKQLGLEKGNFFPTAGSYVSAEVEEFTHSVGICMIVGYGLTESLATVSCDHKGEPYTIGSVGRPIEGIEIRIGENEEILLKGPTITKGYYKRDALNAQSFTEDGFFKTGDAGYLKDGELFLKERIKELFKTSNGKYIAPQMIEAKLLVDKYIEQLAVIADQRKFVSALIVPSFAELEEYAKDNRIEFKTHEDLCHNAQIIQMLTERIETLQQQLANYEKIKRFVLLPKPFTMESGELTNTLKIKRAVLNKNYAEQIEEMYKE